MTDHISNNPQTQSSGMDLDTLSLNSGLDHVNRYNPAVAALRERYFDFLRRKWWIFLASIFVFLAPAISYVVWWPVSYAATARMWVAGKISLQDGSVYEEQPFTFAETQVGILESDIIRHRALVKLRESPESGVAINVEDHQLPFKVRVTQIRNGGLLELSGKGPTQESVKAFLNNVMDEYLLYKKEARIATSGDTYASLAGDIGKQQGELKIEQDRLTAYERDNKMVVQEQQAQAAGTYLSQLSTEFARLKMQFELLDKSLKDAQLQPISGTNLFALESNAARLTEPGSSTLSLNAYLGAQEEVEKLKLTRARLSEDMRPQHPKILKLDADISRAEKLIEYLGQLNHEQLAALRQNLKLRMDIMQDTIKAWETKVGAASERIAEFERLKSNVERVQAVQGRLLNLLQSVDLGRSLNSQTVSVLDRPSQANPTKLPASVVLALAIFLGICVGAVLILLAQRFSDMVTSTEDLRLRFDEWVIGQVPNLHNGKSQAKFDLPVAGGDSEGFGESFRNLRSALLFGVDSEQKRKTLLVTSATPDEGKSTVAANLARTLALAGSRVLLVDGDLRCGRLHEFFSLAPAEGLAELLTQGGDPARFIKQTSVRNLFFLPRGGTKQSAGELFVGSNFDLMLQDGRRQYDYVVIDSVPVFAADDATSMAPKVDGVLFVVRGSFVGAGTIQLALQQLYERHATVLGLVLNRVNCASSFYRYNKYDKYYHETNAPKLACNGSVDA